MADVQMRAPLEVRICDAHVGIWQESASDPTLRSGIYAALIRAMKARGWSIRHDPKVLQHYRSVSPNHRLGERGSLRCAIEISGRVVRVEYWSEAALQDNPNGRRYDFNRMARMPYIDRLRVDLETTRIVRWLETIAPVTISRSKNRSAPAMQRIEAKYAERWHSDKAAGRPLCQYDRNRESKDGALLEQAQTVWLADRKGRIVRGAAYYNINNMWWVIAGGQLLNEGCADLYVAPPGDLRSKQNQHIRRGRLECELAVAVERMNFLRAQQLKQLLFGVEPLYQIWSRKHQAYYRAQYAGYTSDRIRAGKYTRSEAEAECRRVPESLEMVCPDGSHVAFDRKAA